MSKKAKQYIYEEIFVGQTAEFDFAVSKKVISDFAKLSGDKSPLHTDLKYAKTTEFKKPVAHGMIAGMLFSRLVGMELPGKYCLYLSQILKFHLPAFSGSKVRVCGQVLQKTDAFKILIIKTEMYDKKTKQLLVDGQAIVRVLK